MPRGRRARRIRIPEEERAEIEALARSTKAPWRLVQRARIVLLAEEGLTNVEIARRLGCSVRTVSKWRVRFASKPCRKALEDAARSGRPPRVAVAVRCEVVKLACQRPNNEVVPFQKVWTWQGLADALYEATGVRISRTEVGRILRANELRPHRVRYWLHSADPEFGRKTERICELYLRPPAGSHVLCIDEKPMQVLGRRYRAHVGPKGQVRYEYEYKRNGTRVLLAAFDVGTGQVYGQVRRHRRASDLVSFMEAVAARYGEGEVVVVWDNLNIHHDGPTKRWEKFNWAHGGRFRFVYTPLHASWLNQIEIWFSILQRRVLRYGDFKDAKALEEEVLGFIEHWNKQEAHPFRWTFRGRFTEDNRQRRAA